MCKATIDLVSPSGVPITLEVSNDDEQQTIIGMLDRAEKIGVSIDPGHIALMRIPLDAYSSAQLLVSPITPCLEA